MNIQVIAEHSVDMDLLPKTAIILDAGCRGFLFTDEMRRHGHVVLPVDIDKLDRGGYLQRAIGGSLKRVGIKRTRDPQATSMVEGNEIDCIDIATILKESGLKIFDLIKLDIEGSEYEVIMSMDRPYSKQLSIEFHLHTGIYGENEMLLMENKLLWLGYFPVKHDKTRQHGLSYNYWDSLFILK